MDLDFVGSPLLVPGTSCGPMVVAATKNDTVYGWRRDSVAAGWAWKVAVEPYAVADPFVSQLAWSTATSSVYAVTGTELVRIKIGASCSASVVWRKPLGTHTENGSPTVAGNVVWFANNGTQTLVGYNATTGARVFSAPLGGTTLRGADDRRRAAGRRDVHRPRRRIHDRARGAPGSGRRDQTRADELGRRQARLAGPAERRLRDRQRGEELAADLSATGSRARSGSRRPQGSSRRARLPGACMCATRQLWTSDAGKSWHATKTLSGNFVGGGGRVYFWEGGTLRTLALPAQASGGRLAARTIESVRNGTIVAGVATRAGAAVLVSARVDGQGWDTAPRVIVASGSTARVVTLPAQPGQPLAQTHHGERQSSDRHRVRLHRPTGPQAHLDVDRRWVDLVGRLSGAPDRCSLPSNSRIRFKERIWFALPWVHEFGAAAGSRVTRESGSPLPLVNLIRRSRTRFTSFEPLLAAE